MACHRPVSSLAAAYIGLVVGPGSGVGVNSPKPGVSDYLMIHLIETIATSMQVTSVLGDTVTDTIQSTSGGTGTAQFPARAVSPPTGDAASSAAPSTVAAGGRHLMWLP